MEFTGCISVWILFSLLCGVICSENSDICNERLNLLEREMSSYLDKLAVITDQMSIDKTEIQISQERRILSLKTEVKRKIQNQVTEALTRILRSDSVKDLIQAQVISEVRHLKRANHHMRKELNNMATELRRVQEDNKAYRDALKKDENEERELNQKIARILNDSLLPLNNNNNNTGSVCKCSQCSCSDVVTKRLIEHDREIKELKKTLTAENRLWKESNTSVIEGDSKSETTIQTSSTISSANAAKPTTTRLTTTESQAVMSRIFIAPLFSPTQHQFRRVHIHGNSFDVYPYLNLKTVTSVLYVSKLNTLLIGLRDPNRIISSKLDSSRFHTVRHNVRTYGMTADEERGVLFLTTSHPSATISSITLQRKNFTVIVRLKRYGSWPRAIVVHPAKMIIYACDNGNLFTVRYDGSGLTTLDTGDMRAVTLDISNSHLYYGNEYKLMKMSLSTNTSIVVTEFGFKIWNLIYYRDTVYYISYGKSPSTLGALYVENSIVSNILHTVEVSGVNYFGICLIP